MSSTTSPENGRSNRLTIREVADLAGVSTATVSRVINGRAEVSERAREAVLRVVREHGYSTNRTARGLSAGRTGLVGVTTPVVHHSYFAVILDGAGEALYEQDMRMVLCPTHHEHDREVTLLERLMQGTTDGALLILPEESHDELAALHDHGYRFVIVDPLRPLDERVPDGVGRAFVGRQRSGRAPAVAGSPADRRDHRPARMDRDRGAAARLPRRARGRRADARSRARGRVRLPRRGRRRGGAVAARRGRSTDRDLRLQRHARDRRDAGGPRYVESASPRTCRSSGSTTRSRPRSSRRRSPRCASRWPRWGGWR